jgi:drug/metabolite transporter (DMT)-like permease
LKPYTVAAECSKPAVYISECPDADNERLPEAQGADGIGKEAMQSRAASPQDARQRIALAVLWMGGALISFTLVAIAGRAAARGADALQIAVWRTIIGFSILLVIAKAQGIQLSALGSKQPTLQLVRNIIHFTAQFSWLYALTRMTLAELTALEFTAPLWVALLAPFLIGERLNALRLATTVLGFIGVLIVVRPGAVPLGEGTPFGILAAVGFALSMIATKRLLRTDNAFTILFWMQGLQVVIGLTILLSGQLIGVGQGLTIPDAVTFGWLAAVGILGLTAHYSLAKAFTYADTIVVAPMDFLRLPLIAAVGVLLYAEPLDLWVLGGGLVVVIANLINLQNERRHFGSR